MTELQPIIVFSGRQLVFHGQLCLILVLQTGILLLDFQMDSAKFSQTHAGTESYKELIQLHIQQVNIK